MLKGAGKIGATVREFISTEIKVKVEVPALELLPDGSIVGGNGGDGVDVLAQHQDLAETDPNVTLGPDSVGTLSFTSGSTGIPKGVKGRHYSLTHFFPWMGERFGLGEHSKFTMLSGIAHDPIQRDSTSVAILSRFILTIMQCSPHCSSELSYMCRQQTTLEHLVGSRNGWPIVR